MRPGLRTAMAGLALTTALHAHAADPAGLTAGALAELDLLAGDVQQLVLPPAPLAPFVTTVAIDGAPHELKLAPYSVRSADFQLLVQIENSAVVEVPAGPVATVRGVVSGVDGSLLLGEAGQALSAMMGAEVASVDLGELSSYHEPGLIID